jgi:8-oxo-dGTP diphosphatase
MSEVPGSEPAPEVAVAVVTSPLGVLAGRRIDSRPLWAFPGGCIESWETPAEAAMRESHEEACLDVVAGPELGRRVHPATGCLTVYVMCEPAGRPARIAAGGLDELAEVTWLSLAEADRLMADMFGPVRDYLARTIGSLPSGAERVARCEELFSAHPDAVQPPRYTGRYDAMTLQLGDGPEARFYTLLRPIPDHPVTLSRDRGEPPNFLLRRWETRKPLVLVRYHQGEEIPEVNDVVMRGIPVPGMTSKPMQAR